MAQTIEAISPIRPMHPIMATRHSLSVWYKDSPICDERQCCLLLGNIKDTNGHFPIIGTFEGVVQLQTNTPHFKIPLMMPTTTRQTLHDAHIDMYKFVEIPKCTHSKQDYFILSSIMFGCVVKSLILSTTNLIDSACLYNSIYDGIYGLVELTTHLLCNHAQHLQSFDKTSKSPSNQYTMAMRILDTIQLDHLNVNFMQHQKVVSPNATSMSSIILDGLMAALLASISTHDFDDMLTNTKLCVTNYNKKCRPIIHALYVTIPLIRKVFILRQTACLKTHETESLPVKRELYVTELHLVKTWLDQYLQHKKTLQPLTLFYLQ